MKFKRVNGVVRMVANEGSLYVKIKGYQCDVLGENFFIHRTLRKVKEKGWIQEKNGWRVSEQGSASFLAYNAKTREQAVLDVQEFLYRKKMQPGQLILKAMAMHGPKQPPTLDLTKLKVGVYEGE